MKAMVIDVAKCNGCFNCQIACKDEHCGQAWLPYAAAQPETGQFWMKVTEKVRGQVPVVKVSYLPRVCAHCDDCALEAIAPDAMQRRDDGLVLIDPEKAKGLRELADACPAGAVYFNEELGVAQKCTGCAHLLDNGWSVPRCVDACATGALVFGEEEELADLIEGAEPLPELAGKKVRVWYRNLPRRFVAACLVDFEADEVVIGADVQLHDANGTVVAEAKTDEFGDVLFDGLQAGAYELRATMQGYADFAQAVDVTEKDITMGDLAFTRA